VSNTELPVIFLPCFLYYSAFIYSRILSLYTNLNVMTFAFVVGKHNGSSISVVGRNPVFVKEMPIVGGGGLFRFASTGYPLAHAIWSDNKTGDTMVEYNLFVWLY
jgi:hypothetical protein